MYADGEGSPQDYAERAKWLRKVADQGVADAQYHLGITYDRGDGVPQNYAEAYVWFSIAAANGQANAKQVLPRLKAKLTPDQFAAAQKRATQIFKQINANKE